MIIRTNSPNETQNLAESLSPFLAAGDVISLCGDLGAGKTCFTQGLAKGLGIGERVTSPTFNLIKEYRNTLPLYHFDVYKNPEHDSLPSLVTDITLLSTSKSHTAIIRAAAGEAAGCRRKASWCRLAGGAGQPGG